MLFNLNVRERERERKKNRRNILYIDSQLQLTIKEFAFEFASLVWGIIGHFKNFFLFTVQYNSASRISLTIIHMPTG